MSFRFMWNTPKPCGPYKRPAPPTGGKTLAEEFKEWRSEKELHESYVVTPSGCHEWTGLLDADGYARLRGNGSIKYGRRAYRAQWIRKKGPVPEGHHVLHRCDNRKCVNIRHLWTGTNQDNRDDMFKKGRQKWSPEARARHSLVMKSLIPAQGRHRRKK